MIVKADAIEFLRGLPDGSCDLVFGSPPYELARLYLENGENMGIARNTEAWVAWMVEVFKASLHACKGLVAFVVEGQTRNFRYSAGPALLMADLHRTGINLRKPPIFHRIGIPGSGGPDWLRNDYEFIICATSGGKLPWSDNTAMGHLPKWAPGGAMSHRNVEGVRKNDRDYSGIGNAERKREHRLRVKGGSPKDSCRGKKSYSRNQDGSRDENEVYLPPALANPGNNIESTYTAAEVAELLGQQSDWFHTEVGGGVMAESDLVHENEAPFPEKLAEFFVLSFCPSAGTVCDPFSGSGTTAVVSVRHGRKFMGCDIRQSQVDLAMRRLAGETPMGLYA